MKKINKTQGENPLVQYENANPQNSWDDFRNEQRDDYGTIRNLLLADQGGLCAYCETKIDALPKALRRVEHYHSKSDDSDVSKNWALDWQNVIGVCMGGSGFDRDPIKHPLPENLSCDAYKEHLIGKNKLAKACEGYYINPLELIATPCLFEFNKATGDIFANEVACAQWTPPYNRYDSTLELVEKTIDMLNLNCQRLKDVRLEVLKSYNQGNYSAQNK